MNIVAAFAYPRKATTSFVISVRLSAHISAGRTGRIFMKFGTGDCYGDLSGKVHIRLKSGSLHEDPRRFVTTIYLYRFECFRHIFALWAVPKVDPDGVPEPHRVTPKRRVVNVSVAKVFLSLFAIRRQFFLLRFLTHNSRNKQTVRQNIIRQV